MQPPKATPSPRPAAAGQPWPHWAELDRLLAADEPLGEQLSAVLAQERDALQQRDYATFEQLLTTKQQLVAELEQRTQQRQAWLQQLGCPDERHALARAEQEQPEVAARWHRLAERWRECQQANQINEQICQRTRVVVGRLLDLLRGDTQGGGTYDASGSARRLDSSRRIGDA